MSNTIYAAGDTVVVRPGIAGAQPDDRTCRIIQALPAEGGEVQYRVRFGNEVFDRRITATDIEALGEASDGVDTPAAVPVGRPWLAPVRIRAR